MQTEVDSLSSEDRAIVEEEQALLARARASLEQEKARAPREPASEMRSIEALRALRDEAASARAEDLPPLLLEMSIRQQLLERGGREPLPNVLSPYVAHLRVREEDLVKDYLLGRASFLDPSSGIRIVDWRVAPVAQIFYRYREGDTYEETFPGRVAEGTVEARRIVVITNGILRRIVGDRVVLTRDPDGRWSRSDRGVFAFMPGGAGTRFERYACATNISGLTRDRPITRRFPSGFTVYPSASRHDVFPRLEQRVNAHSTGEPVRRPFTRSL